MDSKKVKMKKIYCINCNKVQKISYIYNKTLVLSIICDNWSSKGKKYFKKKYPLRFLKLFVQFKMWWNIK